MQFEDIYKAYWQKIFRLCLGYVNDLALAQDLAQETFITIWSQLPKFRNEASISTWIFRIAVNTCLRQIEKEKRMTKTELSPHLKAEEHEPLERQIQLLYQYISELPENDRIIISLELEGMKQAEIASVTGFSEGNIRVKVHRIKEKLNKRFNENENE
jgi:RNA polymerase sigma-70 factor (ECF subfamily)